MTYDDQGEQDTSSAYERQLSKSDFKVEGKIKTPSITGEGAKGNFPAAIDYYSDVVAWYGCNQGSGATVTNSIVANPDATNNGGDWVKKTFYDLGFSYGIDLEADNTDYIDGSDDADYSFTGSNDFSISLWISNEVNSGTEYVFTKDGAAGREYSLYFNSGRFYFRLYDNVTGGWIGIYSSVNPLTSGEMGWLTATYDGSALNTGLNIYLNSTSIKQATQGGGTFNAMYDTSTNIQIGAKESGSTWDGVVDETILWKKELSSAEITSLYSNYTTTTTTETKTIIGFEDVSNTLDLTEYGLGVAFTLNTTDNNDDCYVSYEFLDITDTFRSLDIFTVERDVWLTFKIEIDLLRSQAKFEFSYLNGTDIDDSEVTLEEYTTYQPEIYSADVINLFFGNYFVNDGTLAWLCDYIKAPFEEFQWEEYNESPFTKDVGNGYFQDYSEFGSVIEIPAGASGLVTDQVAYKYTIPYCDGIQGTLYANTNATVETDLDETMGVVGIYVCSTYANNGSISHYFSATVGYAPLPAASNADPQVYIDIDGSTIKRKWFDTSSFNNKVEAPFSFYINPNKIATLQVNIMGEVIPYSLNISDSSNEVSVIIYYLVGTASAGASADDVTYNLGLRDFQPSYRNLFGIPQDIADLLPDNPVGAIKDGTSNILMQVGRLIGSTMAGVGDLLLIPIEAINVVVSAISTAVGSIDTTISSISSAITSLPSDMATQFGSLFTSLESVVNGVTDAIGGLAQDVFDQFDTILSSISDVLDDVYTALGALAADIYSQFSAALAAMGSTIWSYLISNIATILDSILSGLESASTAIIDVISTVLLAIIDTVIDPLFSDIMTYVDLIISGLVIVYGLVLALYGFITTYPYVFFVFLTLYIFYGASNQSDSSMDYLFNLVDIMKQNTLEGINILGFGVRVPLGAWWVAAAIFWGVVYGA